MSASASGYSVLYQTAVPTTGQTVVVTDNAGEVRLYINPAGTLAALTVTMPAVADRVVIHTTQILTLLTINGGTILNPASSMAGNDCVVMHRVSGSTWAKATL